MFSAWQQPYMLWARLLAAVRNSMPFRYPDLGLICLGAFIELIGVGAIVPIRTIYARDHGSTAYEIGLMGSAFLLGQLAFQLPGGWASDKWGRKPLLVAGIGIAGVISFAFLLSDNPWYFIVLRFVEGAAGGAIGPASNAYVMDAVPRKERGAAFGWLGSAFSAGFMMGPAIGGLMVDGLGYASPFIFGTVTSLGTALFLWKRMVNRRPGDRVAVVEDDAAPEEPENKNRPLVPRSLFVPALTGALALTIAGGIGDGIFITVWTLWLKDLHASTSLIGLSFVTFSLPLMVLMPFTGKWADKYRLAPLIMIPGMLISLVYLTYGVTTSIPLIVGLGVLEGTMIAVMMPAVSAYIANLSPDNARGRLQGVFQTVRTIAGFASSMVTSVLYAISMSYPWFMLFACQIVISILAGLTVMYVERRSRQAAALAASVSAPRLITGTTNTEAPLVAPVLDTAAK